MLGKQIEVNHVLGFGKENLKFPFTATVLGVWSGPELGPSNGIVIISISDFPEPPSNGGGWPFKSYSSPWTVIDGMDPETIVVYLRNEDFKLLEL